VEEILPPVQQASAAQGIEVEVAVAQRNEDQTAEAGIGSWFRRTVEFFRATRAEMDKVTWPTREELYKATRMILVLSIILGLLIGWMDLLLQKILVDGVALLAR
jgi:preprotein translocase subunit SecE